MWLINKLEQDRWLNWQDSVLLKLGFWDRFSQEHWTAEPGSCSRQSWLVFSALVEEQEVVLGIDLAKGTLCLQFWQSG